MVTRLTRRSAVGGGLAAVIGGAAPGVGAPVLGIGMSARAASATHFLAGVNLAGAEFGDIPGVYGKDYIYPSRANIDYYAGLGFKLVRLPFRWERLQPFLSTDLDPKELHRIKVIVDYASAMGLHTVLDPHNYARRRLAASGWQTEHMIGSDMVSSAAFADFWSRLAMTFKDNANVWFGLMNEPHGISVESWLQIANDAIAAIRGTGARNLILAPGIAFTGAHSWIAQGNAAMSGVVDPGRNFAFEVHQYLDADSSGTSPVAVSATIGSERLTAFQAWARENGFKAFLGEFGAAGDATSLAALENLCRMLAANRDVWIGSAAWAGGTWWPADYMLNLEPVDGQVRAQTRMLSEFARRG